MSRKVEAEIQAQIDKMRKEYMTVNELLERIERLKQVNDEQAAVLTACQDENERLGKLIIKYLGEQDG